MAGLFCVSFPSPHEVGLGQFVSKDTLPCRSLPNHKLGDTSTVIIRDSRKWVSISTRQHRIKITADKFQVQRVEPLDTYRRQIAKRYSVKGKGHVVVGHYKAFNPHFEIINENGSVKFSQAGDIVYAYECIDLTRTPLLRKWFGRTKMIILSGATDWDAGTTYRDEAKIIAHNTYPTAS